ncbi:DUF481 domain-containing protein [Granulicella arctica]|uniref:DUF481 domain-containing protein n=1 Tax=Granulicella arctica TaxID=940613 RepID=A0A7Y9PDD4_9BACT|nr:DUF481 domain-containing protein [Granulicella arctica]NYF77851.1 hypothetical protein [Granulicella arctica]
MNLSHKSGFVLNTLRDLLVAGIVSCGIAWPAIAQDKPAKPEPDVLVFKNGDQLTGTLLSGAGNSVVFKSDMAGQITVSLDNVKELRSNGSFAVLKKDVPLTRKDIQQKVQQGKVEYADGSLNVAAASGVSSSVPEKDLSLIIDQPTFNKSLQRQSLLNGWKGGATAGATAVQSTNYGTTFNLGLNLVRTAPLVSYLPPHDRQIFNLIETYGKLTEPVVPQTTPATPNSVAKTSIFHTDFEYDRYFTPRFYALGDTSFDHNFAQGLNLQQLYGGGFGWTVIQQPKQQLDVKVDVHYEMQQFLPTADTANQNLIGSTFSEAYRRTLPKKLLLTETGSVLPAWNNTKAYSALGAINLALPTFHRLTVNAGVSDSFLNDPPTGYQKNSFQFTTGIGYTFQ